MGVQIDRYFNHITTVSVRSEEWAIHQRLRDSVAVKLIKSGYLLNTPLDLNCYKQSTPHAYKLRVLLTKFLHQEMALLSDFEYLIDDVIAHFLF